MENTIGFVVLQSQHAPVHSQQQIEDCGGCLAASARLLVGRRQAVLERGSTVEMIGLLGLVFLFLSGFGPLVWALAI